MRMTRVACIGGFLGAGKTTAIIQAARELIRRDLQVGVITNDQGHHLVDTELIRSLGFPAEEVGADASAADSRNSPATPNNWSNNLRLISSWPKPLEAVPICRRRYAEGYNARTLASLSSRR